MRTRRFAVMAALLALGACNFDILNTNQPTLDDLLQNPTRSKLQFFGSGLFAQARQDIQNFIWRVGSMGREGINLSGNNQPDFIEPYFGPVVGGGSFGGTQWVNPYVEIRDANVFLTALAKTPDIAADPVHGVSAGEKAGARAVANTLKALSFMYVIETRAQLGAPVTVDVAVTATPAPFVRQDSVYKYIAALLDSGAADLGRVGTDTIFLFPLPPGFALFATPATFLQFNRALAAKADVLRATDSTATQAGCGGNKTTCYTAALTALGASFFSTAPANFGTGAFYDFGTGSGDVLNNMSEPLSALTFFALQDNLADADTQPIAGHVRDQRVLTKTAPSTQQQTALLGAIPIPGTLKFTVYMTNGAADPTHPIPIIRDEELVLLRAEAEWFTGNHAGALIDLNNVRQNSGKLAATTVTTTDADSTFVKALMKERRYSLLWEQGTRWIDAQRFGRLKDIPPDIPPSFGNPGHVPPMMPVPQSECNARNLTASAIAGGEVVTCVPTLQ
jgi:starch-binding outer membrane protein, SusD/RagB family